MGFGICRPCENSRRKPNASGPVASYKQPRRIQSLEAADPTLDTGWISSQGLAAISASVAHPRFTWTDRASAPILTASSTVSTILFASGSGERFADRGVLYAVRFALGKINTIFERHMDHEGQHHSLPSMRIPTVKKEASGERGQRRDMAFRKPEAPRIPLSRIDTSPATFSLLNPQLSSGDPPKRFH